MKLISIKKTRILNIVFTTLFSSLLIATVVAAATTIGANIATGGTLTVNSAVFTGGTNTFNIVNGTASLDVASGSTVNIDANLTVEATSLINQDLTTDASPTFADITVSSCTGCGGAFTASSGIIDYGTSTDRLRLRIGDTGDVGVEIEGIASQTAHFFQIDLDQDDANPIFAIDKDGKLLFGAGDDTAIDTNLYRSAANTLKTDDEIEANTFESVVATGTAPIIIASTTKVANLNADLLDGMDSSAFGDATAANQTTTLSRIGESTDAASMSDSLFAGQQYLWDNRASFKASTSGLAVNTNVDNAYSACYETTKWTLSTSGSYPTCYAGFSSLKTTQGQIYTGSTYYITTNLCCLVR